MSVALWGSSGPGSLGCVSFSFFKEKKHNKVLKLLGPNAAPGDVCIVVHHSVVR